MEKFDELWEKYHNRFVEWFPTMCFPSDTDEDFIKRMETCIQQGKPAKEVYHLDYSKGVSY